MSRQKLSQKPVPDFEGFTRAIMASWPEGDVDGFTLEDIAEKYNITVPVDSGFDTPCSGGVWVVIQMVNGNSG